MPDILYPPPRPQSVAQTLDSAFRIFRATVLKCLPYAMGAVIIAQLPNIYALLVLHRALQAHDPTWDSLNALLYYLAVENRPDLVFTPDLLWWALYVLGWLAVTVLWGAIPLRQYAIATGHPVVMTEELTTPLRRIPGTLLFFVLTTVAVGIWVLPVLAIHGAPRLWLLLTLLIPASCVAVALSCGWTLLLLTGSGALASIAHSWRLTRGSWMRLMLIYTIALVLVLVFYLLVGVAAVVVAAVLASGDVATVTAVATVVAVILGAAAIPFIWAVMLAVLGDLSVRREGADLQQRIAASSTP